MNSWKKKKKEEYSMVVWTGSLLESDRPRELKKYYGEVAINSTFVDILRKFDYGKKIIITVKEGD